MSKLHPRLVEVTERIRTRSRDTRAAYLDRTQRTAEAHPARSGLSCANLAHAFAAAPAADKLRLRSGSHANLGIVTAYNDMLSAHQPYEGYPAILKAAAREVGAVAQVAGGVPAMCDGVTQGNPGMELSLLSRDVIAMGTAVALSHNMFDAAVMLGVCDKIVPGLVIGALQFGHLPVVFVPAGPMTSGISNDEKSKVRQLFANGQVGRDALLDVEAKAYHGIGTCTFYGTANSNQMLMEVMGLHLPGAAFVHPNTPLRDALTAEAARRALALTAGGPSYTPISRVVDERAVVNGISALMATGGSTNHTIHLVAMAAAAGIRITWDDFDDLSKVVPLLASVYPNGKADVNHFHAAGGMGFLIGELLDAGLLHPDVTTVAGEGLHHYRREPILQDGALAWRDGPSLSLDQTVLRGVASPFAPDGGLRLMQGNLGRGVIKVSAVKPEHRVVEAPALVFDNQEQMIAAHKTGELRRDFVAVIRFQGPRANGMPELHRLTPVLGALQDEGFKVALVTDGRMSGASGKVPAVIHLSPEAVGGGPIGRLRSGDVVRLDANAGTIEALVPEAEWTARGTSPPAPPADDLAGGLGRSLFNGLRAIALSAEEGATTFGR
ncbi:phosphogluconate dehydratase [Azospirillum thermophilum]|uniref:Phosphogluconate dehydratase n=1 Tax=Azospirillum thermophilum TaxID=2202148 RepID=A0A2S2CZ42_9PROT|nr:phosphogluconate dehydratase [Azospirillum thermophilum]AWK89660.1 phosphogluconate dehydratase [Azospirillum thermophilum]